MARKSSPLIVIGAAVFAVGAALAFVLLHNHTSASKTPGRPAASAATTSTVPPASTSAAGMLPIPPGRTAVPVQVPALQGIDGFAKAGNLVNVYATVSKNRLASLPGLTTPEVKLVVSNVEVLAVLSPAPTASPSGSAVYLLALDPQTAEQVIFFATYESLYLTLVPVGTPPALTPGRGYQNAA